MIKDKKEQVNIIIDKRNVGYRIIKYLFANINKEVYTVQIFKESDICYSSASHNLRAFENKGIVYSYIKKDKKRKYWKLTKKGIEVGNLLIEIEKLI